jgi:hypothetical protein
VCSDELEFKSSTRNVAVSIPEHHQPVIDGACAVDTRQSPQSVSVEEEAVRFTVSGPLTQSLDDVRSWVTGIVQRADQLDRTLLDTRRSGTLITMFYVALVENTLESPVYDVLCACSTIPTRYQVQYNQSVTKRRMLDLWKWSLALNAAESMGFLLCLGFRPSTLYQLRSVIEGSDLYRTTVCLFVCATYVHAQPVVQVVFPSTATVTC